MYDRNGLELAASKMETMNSYKMTAVELKIKKFNAYARAKPRFKDDWSMFTIGQFKDSRDAAFIAQEFAKAYTTEQTRQMVTDGTLLEVAKEFIKNTEIPEWQYPAEGFTIEELCNGGYEVYKTNYVDCPRQAVVEELRAQNKKAPPLNQSKFLIERVEELYATGLTYRQAAKEMVAYIN